MLEVCARKLHLYRRSLACNCRSRTGEFLSSFCSYQLPCPHHQQTLGSWSEAHLDLSRGRLRSLEIKSNRFLVAHIPPSKHSPPKSRARKVNAREPTARSKPAKGPNERKQKECTSSLSGVCCQCLVCGAPGCHLTHLDPGFCSALKPSSQPLDSNRVILTGQGTRRMCWSSGQRTGCTF